MTPREKSLYQQVHPVKLLVDVGSSLASTWLLWEARWISAAVVGFVPSVIVTLWLVAFADLERLRGSRLGAYVAQHMPGRIVALRGVGQLVVWAGAALHVAWLIPFGYFGIVLAWINGLWDPAPPLPPRP